MSSSSLELVDWARAGRAAATEARQRMEDGEPVSVVTVSVGCVALAILPAFLLGTVMPSLQQEMSFTAQDLGRSVASFFLLSALTAGVGGRICDRLGARSVMMVTCALSTAALAGIGTVASSPLSLVAFLLIGGMANGLSQPATNLALAEAVDRRFQGIAYALKQSAVPVAALIAGLVVPSLVLPFGWRTGFVCLAVLPVAVALAAWRVLPARRAAAADGSGLAFRPARTARLLVLPVVMAGGFAAATALTAFFVPSGVAAGLSHGTSALLLTLGSILAVTVRLLAGWFIDRLRVTTFRLVSFMLIFGAVGFGLLAWASHPGAVVAGAAIAFGFGWGWPGLFVYGIVERFPDAPAFATGIAQAGGSSGAGLGPLALGWLAAGGSYDRAWAVAAVWVAAVGVLMWWHSREALDPPVPPGLAQG